MRVLAIDPGVSGAVALLDSGRLLEVKDMPTISATIGKGRKAKQRRYVDSIALASMVRAMAPNHVIVERVHSRPSDGHVGAFRFGDSFGVIRGVLGALGLEPIMIEPSEWKPAIGAPADKGKSRARASELFPDHARSWQRVKDDGRAEAAMLGLYGWRRRLGNRAIEW